MDIHRCRFVPYPPAAINALAFSHATSTASLKKKTTEHLRLALGRGNGDIEIWNPLKGTWFQETILYGGKDRSIEGLAWTQESTTEEDRKEVGGGTLRLFSIGLSSSVTEWDLERGTPLRHANGNYGEIWCFAAQPRLSISLKEQPAANATAPPAQYLAAGCADGNIILFSTEDGDLKFSKTLGAPPTKKPRVLSIAWKNRDVIAAGYSDGNVRLYDIRSKKLLRSMSLGKSADGSNEILVWSVHCLPDETIVSGDSTGEVKIWDSRNYSLVQRLQAHRADVLDIASSADGEMIITGGADRRTVAFRPLGSKKSGKSRRWAEIMHRRFHKHDVKALATYESKDMSVLVSGSLDTVPIVVPLREWQSEYHRALPNLPGRPPICSAPAARLLVSWWEREISIWHVPANVDLNETGVNGYLASDGYRLASKILLASDENITSVTISRDGRALAVSTSANVRLFQLGQKVVADKPVLKVRNIELSGRYSDERARIVKFSTNGQWLGIIQPNNKIALLKLRVVDSGHIQVHGQPARLTRRSRNSSPAQNKENNPFGNYGRTITSASFTSDGKLFAVGDISGCVDSWFLEGHEDLTDTAMKQTNGDADSSSDDSDNESSDDESDSVIIQGQRWMRTPTLLPSLGLPILFISFRPGQPESPSLTNGNIGVHATRQTPHPHSQDISIQEDRLIAVTAMHRIVELNVMQGSFSDWTRRNPRSSLPDSFTVMKDRAMDCFWDVTPSHERLYLYGSTWIFMLEMSMDLPEREIVGKLGTHEVVKPAESVLGKRKWSAREIANNHSSGAGDAMPVSESFVGVGKEMKKFKRNKQKDMIVTSIELGNRENASPSEDDDESSAGSAALVAMWRRGNHHLGEVVVNDSADTIHTVKDSSDKAKVVETKTKLRGWWHTLRYRYILGIVSLGDSGSDVVGEEGRNLEVAIVERPLWDVDLPPRYDDSQDWES